MTKSKVLLVSDDFETGQLWAYSLGQKCMEIVTVGSAQEALDWWAKEPFDLTIINVYTSQLDGVALCRQLRTGVINPILLFTYIKDEPYLLEVYAAGVDECIVQPIGLRLFLAKVTAWLRRSWTMPAEALDNLQVGDLCLDPARRQLIMGQGSVIKLTNLEFRLLHLLMSHRNEALVTPTIVERVWGYAGAGDSTLLKHLIYRLRRKVEPDPGQPRFLQTIAGEGYIFRVD